MRPTGGPPHARAWRSKRCAAGAKPGARQRSGAHFGAGRLPLHCRRCGAVPWPPLPHTTCPVLTDQARRAARRRNFLVAPHAHAVLRTGAAARAAARVAAHRRRRCLWSSATCWRRQWLSRRRPGMILTKSHTNRSCGGASSATCCLNPRTARAGWPLPNASSKLGLPRACPHPRPRPRTRRHGHHRALRCPVLDELRNTINTVMAWGGFIFSELIDHTLPFRMHSSLRFPSASPKCVSLVCSRALLPSPWKVPEQDYCTPRRGLHYPLVGHARAGASTHVFPARPPCCTLFPCARTLPSAADVQPAVMRAS